MPPERLVVRERIAPQITASLCANHRSAVDAIQELVDNAVDSRIVDSPLRIGVRITLTTLEITVAGGGGMGPQEIERHYLRWGDSPKRGRNLLGQYGQGVVAMDIRRGKSQRVAQARQSAMFEAS